METINKGEIQEIAIVGEGVTRLDIYIDPLSGYIRVSNAGGTTIEPPVGRDFNGPDIYKVIRDEAGVVKSTLAIWIETL